jgi:hypothetical protein
MKKLFLYWIIVILALPHARAQKLENLGDNQVVIQALINDYIAIFKQEQNSDILGLIPCLYIKYESGGSVNLFISLVTSKYEIEQSPASFYFIYDGVPVFVYTGVEKSVKFDSQHIKGLSAIAAEHLYPEDIIFTIHNRIWEATIKKNKIQKLSKGVSKSRYRRFESLFLSNT